MSHLCTVHIHIEYAHIYICVVYIYVVCIYTHTHTRYICAKDEDRWYNYDLAMRGIL